MRTGHFENVEKRFAPPDPASVWLAEHDSLAVYKSGQKKGQRKTSASLMWDFLRGEEHQGVFGQVKTGDGDEGDVGPNTRFEARRVRGDGFTACGDEPKELVLDGSQVLETEDEDEAFEPSQDCAAAALASSWVDCSQDAGWGKNEWNAVRALAPVSIKNRDVLEGLAQGVSVAEIAAAIGRSVRQVRNIVRGLWKYIQSLDVGDIARHLDDPITTDAVTRRPPSKAGRKSKQWVAELKAGITTALIIRLDLFGEPMQAQNPRQTRKGGPRCPRVRQEIQGQLSLFAMAA